MSLRDDLLKSRYLMDDETEDMLWDRVASFVSQKDETIDKELVKTLLQDGDIIFNSPILMNAGKEHPLASACYVLPVEDNIESIMDLQQLSAKIFKLGAGVGADYSKLRKEGSVVGSGGTSSGPCSFMTLIDHLAEVIKSGGKRRAAIMSSMRIDHPDIDKFIVSKRNDDTLLNTNISVMVTDKFMKDLENGEDYAVKRWDLITENAWMRGDPGVIFIDTINRNTSRADKLNYEAVNACVTGDTMILTSYGEVPIEALENRDVKVWNGSAWSKVIPKVTQLDAPILRLEFSNGSELKCTYNHKFWMQDGSMRKAGSLKEGDFLHDFLIPKDNPDSTVKYTKYKNIQVTYIEEYGIEPKVYCFNEPKDHKGTFNGIVTGNCSEFALLPYESCLIGSINLANYDTLDYSHMSKLKEIAYLMASCLDNVIDHAWYPDERIEEAAKRYRRIGVGVTGMADMLINNSFRYGSHDAVNAVKEVLRVIKTGVDTASYDRGKRLGNFPAYDDNFIIDEREKAAPFQEFKRNITSTTIAPTGSTSIICGSSGSGCEPLFSLAYDRMMRREKEDWYTVVDPIIKKTFDKWNIDLTDERIKEIKENKGSVIGLPWVPETLQQFLVTAQDLSPLEHLHMLIACQQLIGASISKTINLPNHATKEDVARVYEIAYANDVKGITIFRDGCKSTQVLKTSEKKEEKKECSKLPEHLPAIRVKIPTPNGSMYIMTSFMDNKPVEVFCNLGKSGGDEYSYTEALGRLISLCLKKGVAHTHIVKTLKGIRGKDVSLYHDQYIYSVPDAIATALNESVAAYNHVDIAKEKEESLGKKLCPECRVPLALDNGCDTCYNCGYSSCS